MVTLIIIAFAAICNAIMDVLDAHFSTSKFKFLNPKFWSKKDSQGNKYKNGDYRQGERFPGSKTVFVAFTDAWHLFKGLMLLAIMGAVILYKPIFGWADFFLLFAVWGIAFEVTYRSLKT
jgi:hypothetical protein